jgi:probable F420-dependent oxidoreductase
MARPFRFGIQATSGASRERWREQALRIEALGYSALLMPDHYASAPLAPMVALAFAAEATDTLRVGMLVLGNDYKHPATVAKEAATLDALSGGRLEFGLGAGWMVADYAALGLQYDAPGTRIDRLGEAVAIVKAAWAPGPFDFAGRHYNVSAYDGLPKPVQAPRPPIILGGGAPRVLRLAGREADIVGINANMRSGEVGRDAARDMIENSAVRKVGWVREGAGARFDEIELQTRYFIAAITNDARRIFEAVARGFALNADDVAQCDAALVGTVDEVCDMLVARREESGVSYIVVGDDQIDAFAPVVARLAGT